MKGEREGEKIRTGRGRGEGWRKEWREEGG